MTVLVERAVHLCTPPATRAVTKTAGRPETLSRGVPALPDPRHPCARGPRRKSWQPPGSRLAAV